MNALLSKSNFLIHWTGKDIDSDQELDRDREYTERFLNTLKTGLWMTQPIEVLISKRVSYQVQLPTTCFTENFITRSTNHSSNYGHLGFGFSRNWVLERYGNPVLYVRQHTDDRIQQIIAGILSRIDFCGSICNLLIGDGAGSLAVKLENERGEIEALMQNLCSLVKPMSKFNTDNFEFLNESEWRIVYNPFLEEKMKRGYVGTIPGLNQNSFEYLQEDWSAPTGLTGNSKNAPAYFLQFAPDDLELVILPNEKIRTEIWNSSEFKGWNALRSKNLNLLTISESMSF